MQKGEILSSVKDQDLIKKRRDQMIKGAMTLFKEKGFHRTTTREIAKESGFSIGTLYEYIRKKEDVLFLVCDDIYEEMGERLNFAMQMENPSLESLKEIMVTYYKLMDEMQEEILVLYQEVKGLNRETRKYILQKEKDTVAMLEHVIKACFPDSLSDKAVALVANNIFVQGHMWAFRRWILQKQYTVEEYAALQIELNLHGITGKK